MEGAIMAKNQARKRDSGTGCVTCKRGRKNPYMALVLNNNCSQNNGRSNTNCIYSTIVLP